MHNPKLASAASKALQESLGAVSEGCLVLTVEQAKVREQFKKNDGQKAIEISNNEQARQVAHSAVDEDFNSKKKEIEKSRKQNRKDFHAKLVALGCKEPDRALGDNVAIKTVDKVAKKTLSFLGKAGRYVRNAMSE